MPAIHASHLPRTAFVRFVTQKPTLPKKELKNRKDCDKIGRRIFCAPIGIKQHQLTILKSIAG